MVWRVRGYWRLRRLWRPRGSTMKIIFDLFLLIKNFRVKTFLKNKSLGKIMVNFY